MLRVLFLGWTLNCEMFFYCIFGLAIAINKRRAPWIVVGAISALVLSGALLKTGDIYFRFYSSPLILEFCFGIGVYFLCKLDFSLRSNWLVAAAFLMFVYLVVVEYFVGKVHHVLIYGVPAAAFIFCIVQLEKAGRTTLYWIVLLGDASYSLYLIHPFLIRGIYSATDAVEVAGALALFPSASVLLLAVAASLLVYRFVEQPLLRLSRKSLKV